MSHIKKAVAAIGAAALLAGGAVASANVPDEDLAPPSTVSATAAHMEQGEFVVNGFVVQDDLMIAKIAGHQARDAAVAR